jgi:hypothetical protein
MAKLNTLSGGKAEVLGKLHDSLHAASASLGSTDTILVGATYGFNLAMLFLLFISEERTAIFFVFFAVLVAVNALIVLTFRNSRELREKLHSRQGRLYKDIELDDYFDDSVIQNYRRRYALWITLDMILGAMVLIVALLVKYNAPPA